MTDEWRKVRRHQIEAQRRRQAAKGSQASDQAEGDDDTLLDEIFAGEVVAEEAESAIDDDIQPIRARDVSLISVDEQSVIRTRIYPRTFHCQSCGHFSALDPQRPPATLVCPCCSQDDLVQEPILFMCARCANVREISPRGAVIGTAKGKSKEKRRESRSVKDFLGGPPPCPDCQGGHIHLEKHDTSSIEQWEWRCVSCKSFHEIVQELCFECYVPGVTSRNEEDELTTAPGDIIFMNAYPAAASNALRPLINVQMFVGDEPLEPSALLSAAREAAQDWPDYFEMRRGVNSRLSPDDLTRIAGSCVANAYLLNHVDVITTVYGYRAGWIANHPKSPVDEGERLARFFKDPEGLADYICYGMSNQGAALVIELNKSLILERLNLGGSAPASTDYERLIEVEADGLADMRLKEIFQLSHNSSRSILIRSLHGLEHAMLLGASQRLGSEVLGSKLFLKAGVLLLYEREPVGRGGVVQLVNWGEGFAALVASVVDYVSGCAQGCADGCPACIFIRDAYCQHDYESLGRRWLPSNTLLSRTGARILLTPDA
jgi:hypothetical protein